MFQKAYEITRTPRTAAQLGLCEMALGYWLAADAHLTEALAGRNHWIDRNRATIEGALRRAQNQIGELSVSGTPVGATVTINGKIVGTLPLAPVRVAAGQFKVDLTAPGHKDRSETVVVIGEAKERVTLYLAREGVPIERPWFSGEGPPAKPAGGLGERRPSRDESSAWGPDRIAGAALIGAGVLAIASGATLLFMDRRQNCELQTVDAQCNERTQTRVPGWTLISIGVAAGATGAIIFYSSGSTQAAVSAGPSSLAVSGRFQ